MVDLRARDGTETESNYCETETEKEHPCTVVLVKLITPVTKQYLVALRGRWRSEARATCHRLCGIPTYALKARRWEI